MHDEIESLPMNSTARPHLPTAVWNLALGPLEDLNRPAAVTRRLEQAILLGLIEDGAALPPVAELAGQLNVSVTTVMASLSALRDQGLIETRRGRTGGNFVRPSSQSAAEAAMRQLAGLGIDAIRDRRDYYSAIAAKSAFLAATRATSHMLSRLLDAANAIGGATTPGEALQLDARFHLELAASTRSSLLTQAALAAQSDVTALLWIPGYESLTPDACRSEHANIMSAVLARDAQAASIAAEQHLSDALNQLIEVRMRFGGEEERRASPA